MVDGQIDADEQTDVGLSRGGPGSFGVGLFHVLIDQSNREVGVISFSRQLDGLLVAGDGGQPPLELGSAGTDQLIEPLDLAGEPDPTDKSGRVFIGVSGLT